MEASTKDSNCIARMAPISGVLLTLSFAYSVGTYSYGEYGHKAFHDLKYPDDDFRKNHSSKSLCETNTSSKEYHKEQRVQADVSQWSIFMALAQGIPLLISAGLFSSLSDSKGRKPFILVSNIGIFLKALFMCVAVRFQWNIYIFVVFSFIDGCCGSWVTQISLAMAMVSDLTDVGKSRSFLIAMVGFMISMGYASGSFASGFIINKLGFTWGLAISSMTSIVPMIILYFIEETLDESKRIKFDCNMKTYFKNLIQFYIKDDPVNKHSSKWRYVLSLSAFVFVVLPRLGSFSVEIYYVMDTPFCFKPVVIGIFQTSKTIVSDSVILLGIKLLQNKFNDETIALIGSASSVVSFILIGIAPSTSFLIVASVIGAFGLSPLPLIRSIMSKMTPVHKQGTMYAGIAIVENICACVGSVMGSSIYSVTVEVNRGIVFFVFSIFLLLASVLLVFLILSNRKNRNGYEVIQDSVEEDSISNINVNVT
ncbi:lysosomal proton-coupled steroid conjugate and bile acid symporter SLC46A3-like [Saccostrea cucullata]|uniref:lysosomal proton-coupled steroid conjugate and bile acid symporter SLC46A3-like n=1 Tax=Saccostrea cuccullata TaxID=36930 RepID=UPI002ED02847